MISSSLSISTNFEDSWNEFKKYIIYQKNGNFVISITKQDNSTHSFYANLIKAKKCNCCDSILLYFKYNIITINNINPNTEPNQINTSEPINDPYLTIPANLQSNITYNLKSCTYKTIRFFNSKYYSFNNKL